MSHPLSKLRFPAGHKYPVSGDVYVVHDGEGGWKEVHEGMVNREVLRAVVNDIERQRNRV